MLYDSHYNLKLWEGVLNDTLTIFSNHHMSEIIERCCIEGLFVYQAKQNHKVTHVKGCEEISIPLIGFAF